MRVERILIIVLAVSLVLLLVEKFGKMQQSGEFGIGVRKSQILYEFQNIYTVVTQWKHQNDSLELPETLEDFMKLKGITGDDGFWWIDGYHQFSYSPDKHGTDDIFLESPSVFDGKRMTISGKGEFKYK